MPLTRMRNRKQIEKLQVEGFELLDTLKEVYREANHAFAIDLLATMERCRNFAAYDPVVVNEDPPLCGCPACELVRKRMTTHLRSIAVARAAIDAFMAKVERVKKVQPR